MQFSGVESNELRVRLSPGETIYFDLEHLRSDTFSKDVTPHFREALLARLLAGKLWEPHLTAGPGGDEVLLSGPEPSGRFHVVTLAAGESMFVRLPRLVAYEFRDGGRFRASLNPVSLVRWLIGAVSAVFVEGPATLIFYGRDVAHVEADAGERCFADQVYACTATAPFTISGFQPRGCGLWADLINTVSTTVNMTFHGPAHVVKTTLRRERTNRLRSIGRLLVLGIAIGWLVEKVVTANQLVSTENLARTTNQGTDDISLARVDRRNEVEYD
jgi:hypothetical protein